MKKSLRKWPLSPNQTLLLAVIAGCITGVLRIPFLCSLATVVSTVMIRALQFLSLPIIFLSLISTLSGMSSLRETQFMGKKVLKYTFLTTIIAALIAMGLFLWLQPIQSVSHVKESAVLSTDQSYGNLLLNSIPDNIVRPFLEGNVLSVVLVAIAFGLTFLSLPAEQKDPIHNLLKALFNACLKLTSHIIVWLPLGVWSFIVLLFQNLGDMGWKTYEPLLLYFLVVVGANILQGLVVLPSLLLYHKLSPLAIFRAVCPALSIAFFSKSSNAALPVTMRTVQEGVGVSKKVSAFSLPLCSTINMNGCAAFIFTTTLFVASSYGISFTTLDMFFWVIIATLAAVGNAGVPMGCYFLSGALLTGLHVPLDLLGLILPVYALLDMLETALNVWSDVCVTTVVHKEIVQEEVLEATA